MLQELRRRISAAIYGWDCPLLTFIYPGFDCGSVVLGQSGVQLDPSDYSFGLQMLSRGTADFQAALGMNCWPALRGRA